MPQTVIHGFGAHQKIASILESFQCKKYLLVCDTSFPFLDIGSYFSTLSTPYAVFDDFTPNPCYEGVCNGVALFHREKCDCIVAVGGGSSIDVAKCIKLFAGMDPTKNYLEQPYTDSKIPLIAIPTTAGTGSESTHFAVIYYGGKKQSVAHDSILPDCAILEPSVLKTLPLYQKKCTLLDALCQAIESWWSVRACEESISYSKVAIEKIMKYHDAYLQKNCDEAAEQIMIAANFAGRAINLTTTTAAHAMSYKLTSLYGLPHGHAVAICLPRIWEYMLTYTDRGINLQGNKHTRDIFEEIAKTLFQSEPLQAISQFDQMLLSMEILPPIATEREAELTTLTNSVNTERLSNNPIQLDHNCLQSLYDKIIK